MAEKRTLGKLGRRLIIAIDVTVIAAMILVILSTSVQITSVNNKTLKKEAAIGIRLIKDEIASAEEQVQRISAELVDDVDFSRAITVQRGNLIEERFSEKILNDSYIGLFADSDNNIVWSSDGIDLDALKPYLDKDSFEGYVVYGNEIYYASAFTLVNSMSLPVGKGIVAVDFTREYMLDEIKEVVGFEITIFGGDTRISTTVTDENGERAVGTQMSDKIKGVVIDNGGTYDGTTELFGEKFYTIYEPLYDTDENIIGAIFCGTQTAENDAYARNVVLNAIIAGVIVCVVGGLFLVFYISRRISIPIGRACNVLVKMADGDISFDTSDIKSSDDEIGLMLGEMTKMKDALSMYLTDINRVMSAMADGDFTVQPSVEYQGDFAGMKESADKICRKLSDVIGALNTSASEVSAGSAQISDGSQLLAEGTTRQAAAIEELSATISEMADKIHDNTLNAREADECAAQSNDLITEQAEEMENMRLAMEDIKEKSDQINNIIKTIEDIAFQTNILALNAAVEAARAGEAGKGFAVVADEVRNLATKSDEATKRTAAIISETMDSVAKGGAVVENTVALMGKVSEMSENSRMLVEKIRAASEDQAMAVAQINSGIAQISEVVQQNSATAEESAASCEELNGQLHVLSDQVSMFKILD